MCNDLKPKVNSTYTVEKFDNEILLYSELSTQGVYLNDAAHAVWLLCQEEMTVNQMIQYLEDMYPDHKEQIKDDVVDALETLKSHGVIEYCDDK
jgi:hypothetical protein